MPIDIPFPCKAIPGDPGAARLLGLYPQRRDGLWMQRVKVLGGRLSPEQWSGLGRLAEELTPTAPLHLTTRQDIELHDLDAGTAPEAQRRLAALGLSGAGGCGDTLRNITICPCSGLAPGSVDLAPLARGLRRRLEDVEGIAELPRKFKIALACGRRCGQPWINDLGFVARRRDGRRGFAVTVAGSLGARPAAGIELFEWVEPADVVPLALAAVGLFAELGDRRNRRRARLRHVRERLGDAEFTRLLTERHGAIVAAGDGPAPALPPAAPGFAARRTLTFAHGDVPPAAAEALARLAGPGDLAVRVANDHRVALFASGEALIDDRLAAEPALAGAARPAPAVVACPGTHWCSRALVDTRTVADRLAERLAGELPADATVCVSGCPNGCAHSAVADVGLSGCLARDGNRRIEAFHVALGGAMGRGPALARPAAGKVPADAVADTVSDLLTRRESEDAP